MGGGQIPPPSVFGLKSHIDLRGPRLWYNLGGGGGRQKSKMEPRTVGLMPILL